MDKKVSMPPLVKSEQCDPKKCEGFRTLGTTACEGCCGRR